MDLSKAKLENVISQFCFDNTLPRLFFVSMFITHQGYANIHFPYFCCPKASDVSYSISYSTHQYMAGLGHRPSTLLRKRHIPCSLEARACKVITKPKLERINPVKPNPLNCSFLPEYTSWRRERIAHKPVLVLRVIKYGQHTSYSCTKGVPCNHQLVVLQK